jgi:hypothetical protein
MSPTIVLKDGKQVNPETLRFPGSQTLRAEELRRFRELRDAIDRQLRELPEMILIAQRSER